MSILPSISLVSAYMLVVVLVVRDGWHRGEQNNLSWKEGRFSYIVNFALFLFIYYDTVLYDTLFQSINAKSLLNWYFYLYWVIWWEQRYLKKATGQGQICYYSGKEFCNRGMTSFYFLSAFLRYEFTYHKFSILSI